MPEENNTEENREPSPNIQCPQCHHRFVADFRDGYDLHVVPQMLERILDGSEFRFSCPECQQTFERPYSTNVFDFSCGYYIRLCFDSDEAMAIHKAKRSFLPADKTGTVAERVVCGLAELREKVEIFSNKLDDNVVEFIKLNLMTSEEGSGIARVYFVRVYDGNLEFLAFADGDKRGHTIPVPCAVYDDLVDKLDAIVPQGRMRWVNLKTTHDLVSSNGESESRDINQWDITYSFAVEGVRLQLLKYKNRNFNPKWLRLQSDELENCAKDVGIKIVDYVSQERAGASPVDRLREAARAAFYIGIGASSEWHANKLGFKPESVFDMMMSGGGIVTVKDRAFEKLGALDSQELRDRFSVLESALEKRAVVIAEESGRMIDASADDTQVRDFHVLVQFSGFAAFLVGLGVGDYQFAKGTLMDEQHGVSVTLDYNRILSLALAQSMQSIVSSIKIKNETEDRLYDLECVLSSPEGFFEDARVEIGTLWQKTEHDCGTVALKYNTEVLKEITEAKVGTLCVTVKSGDAILYQKENSINAIAPDVYIWGTDPLLFTAFVSRNAQSVRNLHSHVAQHLELLTGDPSIHCYQDSDAGACQKHCLEVCNAIYNAIQEQGISYANPPPNDGLGGQKIRLADDVFQEHSATCLDSTCLFAAVMEECGLHPVVMLNNNHAFVGCHLLDSQFFSKAVMTPSDSDLAEIRKYFQTENADQAGRFIAIETTFVGSKKDGGGDFSFAEALAFGRKRLENPRAESNQFENAVDVFSARQRGILPITIERKGAAGCPVQAIARYVQVDTSNKLKVDAAVVADHHRRVPAPTGRIAVWANKLMQLNAQSPLLNRAKSPCVIVIDCPDIATFEDKMSDGKVFTISSRMDTVCRNLTSDEWEMVKKHNQLPPGTEERIVASEFAKNHLCMLRKEKARKTRKAATTRKGKKPGWALDLQNLEKLRAQAAEETGAQTLYAAIGSVEWVETDVGGPSEGEEQTTKRKKKGPTICRAPILLVPIVIDLQMTNKGMRVYKREDDTLLNESLVKFLETRNIFFDEFKDGLPADEHGIDVPLIIKTFEDKVMKVDGLSVIKDLCLGYFTFGKFAMWTDLREHADILEKHPFVSHLVNKYGTYDDGIELVESSNLAQHLKPGQLYCPKPMDSTQMTAVLNSSNGKSFLLDGPPGTGKSHTITNIIAHNLASGEGKRILFVAQKETALNVVKERLDKVGLAPFCLQLYAKKTDKGTVLKQFESSLAVTATHTPREWDGIADELCALRDPLNNYVKALHKEYPNGLTAYRCFQKVFDKGESPYEKSITFDCLEHTREQWDEQIDALKAFIVAYGGVKYCRAAIEAISALKNPDNSQDYADALNRVCQALIAVSKDVAKVFDDVLALLGMKGTADSANIDAVKRVMRAIKDSGKMPEKLPDAIWHLDSEKIVERLNEGARLADEKLSLMEKYDAAKKGLAEFDIEKCYQLDIASIKGQIDEAKGQGAISRLFSSKESKLLEEFSQVRKSGKFTRLDEVIELLDKVVAFREIEKDAQAAEIGEFGTIQVLESSAEDCIDTFLEKCSELDRAISSVQNYIDDQAIFEMAIPDMIARMELVVENTQYLRKVVHYRPIRDRVNAAGVGAFAKLVEEGELPADRHVVEEALEQAIATKMAHQVANTCQPIKDFFIDEQETTITDYRDKISEYERLTKKAAFARIASRYPDFSRPGGYTAEENAMQGDIKTAIRKPKSCKSIRAFLKKNATLIEKYKPCFLMTPESVSQFLPMDINPFDLIIFDEASQLQTCDTVGIIARGKQVIVTGDPKQMPPTNFFNSTVEDDDENVEMDSVLDECSARGLKPISLTWHYRSKHESLIDFSNQHYYHGDLNTFPSVQETKRFGIQYEFVPDGIYHKSINKIEAMKVVDYVVRTALSRECQVDLQGGDEPPCIGVVTFNAAQQTVVRNLLQMLIDDPAKGLGFLELKKSDEDQNEIKPKPAAKGAKPDDKPAAPVNTTGKNKVVYFVKNLESVQGDEADIIVFSVGYGPDIPRDAAFDELDERERKRHFPSSYGPLSNDGGQKRLNVAVSRARDRMIVFSSLKSSEVNIVATTRQGPRDFKDFLKTAERSVERKLGASDALPERGLVKLVADFLTENGYEYVSQVGASNCKIDIAVVNKFDPQRFMLGIECDGPMYNALNTVQDRDVGRPGMLRMAKWNMYRVWSAEWYSDRVNAQERLLHRLEELTVLAQEEFERRKAEEEARRLAEEQAALEAAKAAASAEMADDVVEDAVEEEESAAVPETEASEEATTEEISAIEDDLVGDLIADIEAESAASATESPKPAIGSPETPSVAPVQEEHAAPQSQSSVPTTAAVAPSVAVPVVSPTPIPAVQAGGFPYKIGKAAKKVFPVVFFENRVTADDIAWLMSPAAIKYFKTAGNQVLREATGPEDVERFYKKFWLPFGGKQYLLTSEWYKGGLPNLLAWFAQHGIDEVRAAEICGGMAVPPPVTAAPASPMPPPVIQNVEQESGAVPIPEPIVEPIIEPETASETGSVLPPVLPDNEPMPMAAAEPTADPIVPPQKFLDGLPLTEAALASVGNPHGILFDGELVRNVISWKDCYLAFCEKLMSIDMAKFDNLPENPFFKRFFVRAIPHKKYPDCYSVRCGTSGDIRIKEINGGFYFYKPIFVVHKLLELFGIDPARVTIKK